MKNIHLFKWCWKSSSRWICNKCESHHKQAICYISKNLSLSDVGEPSNTLHAYERKYHASVTDFLPKDFLCFWFEIQINTQRMFSDALNKPNSFTLYCFINGADAPKGIFWLFFLNGKCFIEKIGMHINAIYFNCQ